MKQMAGTGSSFKGKNSIGWMVARLDGKLMLKRDKRILLNKPMLSNQKVISQEIEFDEKVSYPYTFTVVCGTRFPV